MSKKVSQMLNWQARIPLGWIDAHLNVVQCKKCAQIDACQCESNLIQWQLSVRPVVIYLQHISISFWPKGMTFVWCLNVLICIVVVGSCPGLSKLWLVHKQHWVVVITEEIREACFFFFQMTRQTQRHIVIQNTHGAYFKKIMRLSLRCPCGLCYHITPSSTTPSLGERAFSCSIALQRPWTVTQEFIQSVINPLVSVILPPSLRTEFVQGIATRLRLLLFSWFSGRIG